MRCDTPRHARRHSGIRHDLLPSYHQTPRPVRSRQIKPAFFKDALIARLAVPVRLFYIGLWMLADDAGYLRWDPGEAANELYGYEARGRRERRVVAFLGVLEEAGRVVVFGCGHVFIPHLIDHQHLAGLTKRVLTDQRAHAKCGIPPLPADARGSPQKPALVRLGSVRLGSTGAQARDDDEKEELLDGFRRQGLPVDTPAEGRLE